MILACHVLFKSYAVQLNSGPPHSEVELFRAMSGRESIMWFPQMTATQAASFRRLPSCKCEAAFTKHVRQ